MSVTDPPFPLIGCAGAALLRAICAVAEQATVNPAVTTCVAAVLKNTHSFSVLGGREAQPRSLGSIYAASVVLFLGTHFRGNPRRIVPIPEKHFYGGVALTRDGSLLLLPDSGTIRVYRVSDGTLQRVVGSPGLGPLQFGDHFNIVVAKDNYVFVADRERIQMLSPQLEFCAVFRDSRVCNAWREMSVSDDIVVVQACCPHAVVVFDRHSGRLIRCFKFPRGKTRPGWNYRACKLVLLADGRQVAVSDWEFNCITIFTVNAAFLRQVDLAGFGLDCFSIVGYTTANELMVRSRDGVAVLNEAGEMMTTVILKPKCFPVAVVNNTIVMIQCRPDSPSELAFREKMRKQWQPGCP